MTICEAPRTIIYGTNFSITFRADAVNTAVFVWGKCDTGNLGQVCKAQYDLWLNKLSRIEMYIEFGIDSYILAPKKKMG